MNAEITINPFCPAGLGDRISLIGSSELVAEAEALTARKKFTLRPVVMEEEEDEEGVEAVKEGTVDKQEFGVMAVINKYINLSLVENPVFLVLAGSVMLMAVGLPHCLFFLPTHVETVGLPPSDASLLLSVSAIFDLTGRIAFGFFLDLNLVPKYVCYSRMMLLSGLSAILLAASSSFLSTATCMALYRIGSGGWFLMVPLLLAEHLGVENIASSYRLVRLAQSTTNLSGPLVAGHSSRRRGRWQPASTSWAPPCCLAESSSSSYQWLCKSCVPRREREAKEGDLCCQVSDAGTKMWTCLLGDLVLFLKQNL